jgi:murein DD-endopeptidase MepM/ murein hydrolase activator NlpD
MMRGGGGRRVTIVVHTDGDLDSKQFRIPLRAFVAGKWAAGTVALLVLLFFAFAGPIGWRAIEYYRLKREVARLEADNSRVQQLAAALNRAEANYQELRQILGGRGTTGPAGGTRSGGRTSEPRTAQTMRAVAVRARLPQVEPRYAEGPSVPAHWPLDVRGFVTRGQVRPDTPNEAHPGIDIAVPVGTPVRASGGGSVEAAGTDPDYGLFVLLRHPDGYETMYGHTSRLLVREGDDVPAGQVIALSGNTGRSTAPHLHFEIRRAGRSLDPLTLVQEGH